MRNVLPVRRRGAVVIYTLVIMTVLCGFMALVVDWGHICAVRNELRTAADAGARAGAAGLSVSRNNAVTQAISGANINIVDFKNFALQAADVQTFNMAWAPTGSSLAAQTYPACQVNARLLAQRGNAVQLTLAGLFGVKQKELGYKATALLVPAINMDENILAVSNPWLAGMPQGTVANPINPHNNPDHAGDLTQSDSTKWLDSPPPVANLPIIPGQALQFDSISGTARHDPHLDFYQPDGDLDDIGGNIAGAEHGMSQLISPINALVGVFLDDRQPDLTPVPTFSQSDLDKCPTDYTTTAARNLTTYQPKLKQVFWIGDGLTDKGAKQNWIVPANATRLYLCTMDYYEWNNNAGSRTVVLQRPQQVVLVKGPGEN